MVIALPQACDSDRSVTPSERGRSTRFIFGRRAMNSISLFSQLRRDARAPGLQHKLPQMRTRIIQ